METLLNYLNYDVSEYIIQIASNDIKNECIQLHDMYQKEKTNLPPEPISGKSYYTWLKQMTNYTEKIKPLESEIKMYYTEIMTCKDFDTLNSILYLDFKDIINEWFSMKNSLLFF